VKISGLSNAADLSRAETPNGARWVAASRELRRDDFENEDSAYQTAPARFACKRTRMLLALASKARTGNGSAKKSAIIKNAAGTAAQLPGEPGNRFEREELRP
jgi:hypothetical protein